MRKMVPINEEYHTKLRQLADANHRTMTKQVEWLVAQAWRNYLSAYNLVLPEVKPADETQA